MRALNDAVQLAQLQSQMREELSKLGVEARTSSRLRVFQDDPRGEERNCDQVDDQARPGTEDVKHPCD